MYVQNSACDGRNVQYRVNIKRSHLFLQFAELGGFEEIKKQIETAEKVDAPVSFCDHACCDLTRMYGGHHDA